MHARSLSSMTCLAATLTLCAAAPATAQPVLVSARPDGLPGNNSSFQPAASASGRFIAFASRAHDLVPGDLGAEDVFLRDRDTDGDGVLDEAGAVSTVRVSERNGVGSNGDSGDPAITPDGRFVVFASAGSNLFAFNQPPLSATQIFRWDRLRGEILLVSRNGDAEPLNGHCRLPAVTADGNTVYFVSYATNDGTGAATDRGLVLRRNIADATLTRASDPIVDAGAIVDRPAVSDDGSVFAYAVSAYGPGTQTRVGGVTHVRVVGQPVRTYLAVSPKLSADGQFLGMLGQQAQQVHLPTGQVLSLGTVPVPVPDATFSRSGRYLAWGTAGIADFAYGSVVPGPWDDLPSGGVPSFAGDSQLTYSLAPTSNYLQVYVAPLPSLLDNDADGLNDHWETTFGLSTTMGSGATGDAGASGDPDADGLTNAQELARGSHPRGTLARYLAEGASGTFFSTRYAIANPGSSAATAAVRVETEAGAVTTRAVTLPAQSRLTIESRALGLGTASFSAVVESATPLAVDRLMSWSDRGDPPYGSHAESSSGAPGTTWILAEGSTVLGFQLFYLLQNPQPTATTATVRFLLPSGSPLVRTYELPARSRTTVFVNTIPGLESTDVSAEISATQAIAVERAMYRSAATQTFALGHGAGAVPAPATTWLFAEGSSNAFFDTYLLLVNPGAAPATVAVAYLQESGGPLTRTYTVPAGTRFSVFVDDVPGLGVSSYGIRVTSDVPVVAERAMYWAGGFFDYYESHASTGSTQHGSRWVLAEGEQGGALGAQTFVLIANVSAIDLPVRVRALPEGTGPPKVSAILNLPAGARMTFPASHPQLRAEGRFGIEVSLEGTNVGGLVVEGAIYWHSGGQIFGAGAAWPATRID
jgi:hypothetical protein